MRLRYSSALVTGASSGIGLEFARVLADRGCDLVLVARRTDRLEALAKELSTVKVEVLAADLGSEAGVAAVEQRLADSPVELLVNNAGIASGGPFTETDLDYEDQMVKVNVLAVMRLCRAAVGPMVAAGHGGIINVSSIAGEQPLRGYATYSASKAYVTTFTEALAAEVRANGVHVTLLKPGYVWTEMNPDGPARDSMQGRIWLEADAVARHAVDAVEKGKLMSVPGVQWRAASGLIQALPRQLVRGLTSRFDAST
ncbi:MAG: SDR family oxidoreductase [Frankiaceae bacterium]|nr:SDR family oxidoreductase [Frankiaceae bacterium]MBV9872128.1 SDR family oxidoreductase [Frankiaceae bacterium]